MSVKAAFVVSVVTSYFNSMSLIDLDRCLDSALTIAACLSYRSPFVSSFDKRDEAKKKKMEFAARNSDHITVLRAYQVKQSSTVLVFSFFFKKMGHSSPLFKAVDSNIKIADDWNRGSLVSEATALPTAQLASFNFLPKTSHIPMRAISINQKQQQRDRVLKDRIT